MIQKKGDDALKCLYLYLQFNALTKAQIMKVKVFLEIKAFIDPPKKVYLCSCYTCLSIQNDTVRLKELRGGRMGAKLAIFPYVHDAKVG